MADIVNFKVEMHEPHPLGSDVVSDDNVVALPNVDLETVMEMVACLRDLGTYRQDGVREKRLAKQQIQAEQTA